MKGTMIIKNAMILAVMQAAFGPIKTASAWTDEKEPVVPGEQAPRADPGQRNFGGFQPAAGSRGKQDQQQSMMMRTRTKSESGTASLDNISMSDPFIYCDENTNTYYLTGTGGRLYKSKDLKMWTGPSSVIDLKGTWMGSSWRRPRFTILEINTIMPAPGATTAI